MKLVNGTVHDNPWDNVDEIVRNQVARQVRKCVRRTVEDKIATALGDDVWGMVFDDLT